MEQKNRILIVDDNEMNTRVAALALDRTEYEIVIAHSGEEALEQASKKTFDLILLDIIMPEMDGYTVCKHLKEGPATENIPIVFLTARTDVESIRKAFACGGSDFISKPFQKAELMARVDTQLRLKRHLEKIETVSNERKQLLHVLSHDLANPIGASLAVVSLIEEDPDYVAEGLPLLRKSLQNGAEIIHFIRKFRSLEDPSSALDLSYENLLEMVDESTVMLTHLWKPKKQRILRDIDPRLSVYVERNSFISAVVTNLLSNAVKFSYPGSEIRVTAEKRGNETVEFAVQDFGVGIPAEILGDLFSFSAATSRSGTEGESGTGYGMPLLKRFVEAYGGNVEAVSDNGGTRISCMLKGR
jgi:two-component system, sensor histidine kinase and response regulator